MLRFPAPADDPTVADGDASGTTSNTAKKPIAPALPPRAPRRDTVLISHGEERTDEFFWLRDIDDPAVRAYLNAENAYTAKVLRPWTRVTKKLYAELRGRFCEDDMEVPERLGDYYYYWKRVYRQHYRVFCRKRGSLSAKEQVVLDLNALAVRSSTPYLRVDSAVISSDHNHLALAADFEGTERHVVMLKDLAAGTFLEETLTNTSTSLEWANDGEHLFYVRQNDVGQPRQVYRHRLGTDPEADVLLYDEPDEKFFVSCRKSKSGRFLFIHSTSNVSAEVHFLDAGGSDIKPRLIRRRATNVEYRVAHAGAHFYIITNDNAPSFRLVRAAIEAPDLWTDFVAHRADCLLEHVEEFSEHLVLFERKDGVRRVRIIELAGGLRHTVKFPEPIYSIVECRNPQFDTHMFRFTYSSLVTPSTVFEYDMKRRLRHLRKFSEVKGGFDPTNYRVQRIFAKSRDGSRIPISLLYRQGLRKNGKNPLYLSAYGAYGKSASTTFSADRFSLVDRGFVYAIAHVRGGQDMGRRWYEEGRLLNKKQSFYDYIDCTAHLIAERYTSAKLVVAAGASAGGLLVGAVANMRPDLYRSVIADVPFVDVLNSMEDPSLPLTASEYDEWGNPAEQAFYDYIKSYSPYDNVTAQEYPHMLIFGAYNDPRVPYWEPAKWAARLRARKTGEQLLLLKTTTDAGHAGKSSPFAALHQVAVEHTFIFMTFGIDPDFDKWLPIRG